MPEATATETPPQRHIGPILLSPGTLPRHIWAYVIVALGHSAMVAFFPMMQPLVLGQAGVGHDVMGRVAGNLALVQSLAVLFFTVIAGTLIDRIGRARLLAFAIFGQVACAIVYPLGLTLPWLFIMMFLFGIAQTCHVVGGATVNMDYPDNASRGKYLSFLTVLSVLGSMLIVGQIAPRIPNWVSALGFDGSAGVKLSYWFIALLVLPMGFVAIFGLKPNAAVQLMERRTIAGEIAGLGAGVKTVFQHARGHRPFRFVLLTALTMRADFAVVTTFLSLWVVAMARTQGIESGEAIVHAGKLYSLVLGGNLVMTLLMGVIIDRVDRRRLIVFALVFVALGMMTPLLVTDIFSIQAYGVALLLGLAEGAVLVPVYALLGQETPSHLRGTTSGVFSLIGIAGVSAINFTGGIVFDHYGATAPFVMIAVANLLLFALALRFLRSDARLTPSRS